MLLERENVSPLEAVQRLVALQAQVTSPPYVGLWTRLNDFRREDLTRLMLERRVVRATLMRATLQLMTADDYLLLRPALQPALTRSMRSIAGKRLDGLDLDHLVSAARDVFRGRAAHLRGPASPAIRIGTGQGPVGPGLRREDQASAGAGAFGRRVGLRGERTLHDSRTLARPVALRFGGRAGSHPQVPCRVRSGDGEGRTDVVGQDATQAIRGGDETGAPHLP